MGKRERGGIEGEGRRGSTYVLVERRVQLARLDRLDARDGLEALAMRLAGELRLEEELFFTLIRIYRTPSVLFEFTKRRDDEAVEEAEAAPTTEE